MSLKQFFQFNNQCPICDNELQLYMQWHDSTMWKMVETTSDSYRFEPYKFIKFNRSEDDSFIITCKDNNINVNSAPNLLREAKQRSMHFMYLCNESGIEVLKEDAADYEINLYNGCYHRSSPMMDFKQDVSSGKWVLDYTEPNNSVIINGQENFAFKKIIDLDLEKVYILSLDPIDNKTLFWFYETNSEERNQSDFEPKMFEKQMPLMKNRPDLSIINRNKLFNRLNSWIVMS